MKKIILLFVLFAIGQTAWAQVWVTGKITDAEGEPLVGATVKEEASASGAVSDNSGYFALQVSTTGRFVILTVRFVGYEEKVVRVRTDKARSLTIRMDEATDRLQMLTIFGQKEYPLSQSIVKKEAIDAANDGRDLPVLLNFQPSVVTTSDAGAGVGYTSMRVRGSDATRTNVTINGIPVNDSESQGVFWVNMPDFAASVEQIQIQRGVGSSTNGAGAFGASVNMATSEPADKAFVRTDNSYGSFNTFKNSVSLGTGLLNEKFKADLRLSKITSDGFMDRSFSDLKSFYLSGMYKGENNSLKINIFSGAEKTYQAWYGVPEEQLKAGNRTFNEKTYENEIDNYQQDHYQLLFRQNIGEQIVFDAALHYTKGRGYFEQYRENDKLKNYKLEPVILSSDTITRSDLIRRRWLDNDFYGLVANVNYVSPETEGGSPKLDFRAGGGWNRYKGKHYGEVIWSQFASQSQIRHRYYDNDAEKTDFNVFAKANWQAVENLFLFADVQFRQINYNFLGFDNQANNVQQTAEMSFFNPKVGLRYRTDFGEFYGSFAVGNKEPNRNDFTESSPGSRPKHEHLDNTEIGWVYEGNKLSFALNYYLMSYKNQLVATGQVNDVGAYVRTNIPDSFRSGLELSASWRLGQNLLWKANAAVSRNKIKNFSEFIDNYDLGGQERFEFENTDIAFSPGLIAGSDLQLTVFKGLNISLLTKYVGKQYLDNTQNENRKLDPYFTQDVQLAYEFGAGIFRKVRLSLSAYNVTDTVYESNGYTYGFIAGGENVRANYYFPQAGRNFSARLSMTF